MKLLQVSPGNAKVRDIISVSLPAGWTCPQAKDCFSKSHRMTGRVTDSPGMVFRCSEASTEARSPQARNARWENLAIVQKALRDGGAEQLAEVIETSIVANWKAKTRACRVHVAGDFFSRDYSDAWMKAMAKMPTRSFYAYTKSVALLASMAVTGEIPGNFTWVASMGGRQDELASAVGARTAQVVADQAEADSLGLEVDRDESLAMNRNIRKFALVIHGTQPPGGKYSEAWNKGRREGTAGYSREKRKIALAMV